MKPYYETELCQCGCGQKVEYSKRHKSKLNKFINGHNNRNQQFSEIHKKRQSIGMQKAWKSRKPKPIKYHGKVCRNCHNIFFIKSADKERMFCSNYCFRKSWSTQHSGINNNMYGIYGERAPNWQGGLSFEPYPPEFNSTLKTEIRELYGNRCLLCNKKQSKRKHDVHHVDYDKENFGFVNLVPLCATCHRKTNFNRKQWMEYFKSHEPERLRILSN